MCSEEIKSTVYFEMEEIWNGGKIDVCDEVMDENYILHEADAGVKDRETLKQFLSDFRSAFPDAHYDIDDLVIENEKAVLRYSFRGKHKGNYMGIEPTGKKVIATGMRFYRFGGDKIQEVWDYLDRLSILVQIGWWVPPEEWILAFGWEESKEPEVARRDDIDKNKEIVRRGLEELWNSGDLTVADDVYGVDFANHEVTHKQFHDLESYKRYVSSINSIMPDFQVSIDDIIGRGDRVATRWKVEGTETETGNSYGWSGVTIFRLSNCKIVEAWWGRDALSVAMQMGITPT